MAPSGIAIDVPVSGCHKRSGRLDPRVPFHRVAWSRDTSLSLYFTQRLTEEAHVSHLHSNHVSLFARPGSELLKILVEKLLSMSSQQLRHDHLNTVVRWHGTLGQQPRQPSDPASPTEPFIPGVTVSHFAEESYAVDLFKCLVLIDKPH